MHNFTMLPMLVVTAHAANPMSLSQAVHLAMTQHPLVRADIERVKGVRSNATAMQSAFQPLVSLNGYAATGRGSAIFSSAFDPVNYGHFDPGDVADLNVALAWRLPLFNRYGLTKTLGATDRKMADLTVRNRRRVIAYAVRNAFVEAALRIEAAQSAQENVASAQEIERVTEQKEQAGSLARVFVLRSQAEVAAAERDLALAKADEEKAKLQLAQSIGLNIADAPERGFTMGEWDRDLSAPESLALAISRAQADHPEILMSAAKLSSVRTQLSLNRAAGKPEAYIMAMGDWLATNQTTGDQVAKLGIVLSFPLSDGGMRRAQVDEQQSKVIIADLEYQDVRNQISTEIGEAWADSNSVAAVKKAAESENLAADEAFKISMVRFQEGKGTLSEVTESRAFLAKAKLGVAEATAYARKAWATLKKAIGSDEE